jgi:hypothetical protein
LDGRTTVSSLLGFSLVSGSYIWVQVSSIVTRQLRNPAGSLRNRSKITSEANIQWCFWSSLRHLRTHLAESFLMNNIAYSFWDISPGSLLPFLWIFFSCPGP